MAASMTSATRRGKTRTPDRIETYDRKSVGLPTHFHGADSAVMALPERPAISDSRQKYAELTQHQNADQIDDKDFQRAEITQLKRTLLGNDCTDNRRHQDDDGNCPTPMRPSAYTAAKGMPLPRVRI